jgi:AraC-like DNA-binding protein
MPATYLGYLLEVVARFGVSEAALLQGTGCSKRTLQKPDARIKAAVFLRTVDRAITLTGEPGLGFYHGLSLKLSAHGRPGLLAMTSATLGDALAVAQRFLVLRSSHFVWSATREGDACVIAIGCSVPSGPAHRFVVESAVVGLLQMGRTLVGHPIADVHASFGYAEPPYYRRFAHLIGGSASFGAEQTTLRFPYRVLDEAILTADSVAARSIAEECEEELRQLQAHGRLLSQIRHGLRRPGPLPQLPEMASRHHMSERTFKRKLMALGTSYRDLVEEVRRERATALLEQTQLTLPEVAERLGYTDVASFHRAFRRWFKRSPGAYRTRR